MKSTLCRAYLNVFDATLDSTFALGLSLLRFLDHMYMCVLEKMTTLRACYPNVNPFQSCPFVSIHASLSFCCISFKFCNSFKWLFNVSFYFLGILGVTKLHHFV